MLNTGLPRTRLGRSREEIGTIAEQFAQYRALKDKVRKEKRRDGNHSGAVCSIQGSGLSRIRLA